MNNIMDYLTWRGDISFTASPFNEIDNLILTQIVYLDFTDIVPNSGTENIALQEAARRFGEKYAGASKENLTDLEKNCAVLLKAMAGSVRFQNCMLSGFWKEISVEQESQFAALRIGLEDGSTYVSFCGTDSSVAGWKENFNMSFMTETPGQRKAVVYLTEAAQDTAVLRVGGHSKGGNLAVYAAMHLAPELQGHLTAIYNNDGPGFTEKMISESGYLAVLERIHTYVPKSSVVGLLLEHEETYHIIHSSNAGLLQHDAFSWEVEGTTFIYSDSLERNSIVLDKALKLWLNRLNDDSRRKFVDSLFSILEKSQIENTEVLGHLKWAQLMELIKVAEGLTAEEKAVLIKTMKLLLETYIQIWADDRLNIKAGNVLQLREKSDIEPV
ncbi:MAG: DUF2974 domain-containing protein [Lachnospiraceae bacterium]|nr:DUF2974 domain-containing protein [Lachnospiraceae bacterium]